MGKFSIVTAIFILAALIVPTVGNGQTIPPPVIYLPMIRNPPPTPTATATPLPTPTATPTPLRFVCDHDYYNCGNFATGPDAQEVFSYCEVLGFGDIHKLDQNNDGIACNALWDWP